MRTNVSKCNGRLRVRPGFAAARSSQITIDIIAKSCARFAKNFWVLNLCLIPLIVANFS